MNATFTRSAKRARSTRRGEQKKYATYTSPIKHFICLPKFCMTFVFHFSWVLQLSQEKLKTMLMQNFGGQIRCIMGEVQVAYKALFFSSPRLAIRARPTLRAKCRVRLAWLIKRLLCRLIITSPDKKNVWNEKKLSPREAGPLGFSCKILLKTALLLRNNCVKYFCNKMPSLIVAKIGLILYPLNRNQLRKVVA